MNLTFSSVLISLLAASMVIIIIMIYLRVEESNNWFKVKYIFFIVLFVIARLLIPVELPITYTLKSKVVLPSLFFLLRKEVFIIFSQSITVANFIVIICFLIALLKIMKLVRRYNKLKKIMYKNLTSYDELKPYIDETKNVHVASTPAIFSPVTIGIISPHILIPRGRYTAEELRFIISHELQHVKNRDNMLKLVTEIIVCFYWWFPLIYFFRGAVNILIELRVDSQVTNNMEPEDVLSYLAALVSVKEKALFINKNIDPLFSNFTYYENKLLLRRSKRLLSGNISNQFQFFIFPIICCLLLVPFVIVEPYKADESISSDTFFIDKEVDNYILKDKDNIFHLIISGKDVGQIDDPHDISVKKLKIIEER